MICMHICTVEIRTSQNTEHRKHFITLMDQQYEYFRWLEKGLRLVKT